VQTSNDFPPLPLVEDPGLINRGEGQTTDSSRPPDPDNPTWGVGGALSVWFASILLVIFLPLAFLIPYASYKGIHFGMPNYLPALVEFATKDKMAVFLQLLALLPTHLITLLLVWALVTRFGRQSFRAAIGWDWSAQYPWWLDLLASILLGIVLFVLGNVIARLLGAEKSTQLEQLINSSLAARYAISFLAVFTAPFAEEFVYRGVLYAALRKTVGVYCGRILAFVFGVKLSPHTQDRLGVNGAVFLVLALFTVIHVPQYWPNFGVIAAVALLSIVLTLVRAYSGRLLPCIVIHIVFNGIQALVLVLEPYLHRFLPTPDQVAPTAGFLLSFINLLF
jgi:membrane protease YdiL (CAAX protease family)